MALKEIRKLTDLEIERRGPAIERVKAIIVELHEVMGKLILNNDIVIKRFEQDKDNFLRVEEDIKKILEEKIPYIHNKINERIRRRISKLEDRIAYLELPFYKRTWRRLRRRKK